MVDQDLQSASRSLERVVSQFDVIAILTAATGIGAGLFVGEFAGSWATDRLQGQSNTVGFLGDVGARGLTALAFVQGAKMNFNPTVDTLMLLAAFGAASSAVLRMIESVAEAAAGNVGSAPIGNSVNVSSPSRSNSGTKTVKVSSNSSSRASANGSFGNANAPSSF